ncbi:hypothetical protein THIOM_003247 [Candidatus Thiomargarita nelsonii]|uniref:Uncharacterized protein n=1 Tax=Candidatus Thiomargarita nelsonii TaxID=1003181 RepID=A0A176RZ23_9GAMM|nr:hypothetical protein THIOM_003247 [Candidatus Thiomargarita nelsonii]
MFNTGGTVKINFPIFSDAQFFSEPQIGKFRHFDLAILMKILTWQLFPLRVEQYLRHIYFCQITHEF